MIPFHSFKAFQFQTPLEKAESCKGKGNKYFKASRFDKAIECYTEAIEVCPTEKSQELATYYQNRAAAHEQLVRFFFSAFHFIPSVIYL